MNVIAPIGCQTTTLIASGSLEGRSKRHTSKATTGAWHQPKSLRVISLPLAMLGLGKSI